MDMRSPFYDQVIKYAQGVLIVYAINDRNSFECIENHLEEIFRIKEDENFEAIILVGTKSDLDELERYITTLYNQLINQSINQ